MRSAARHVSVAHIMLNAVSFASDFYPYPTYYTNITGLSNYFNFRVSTGTCCDPAAHDPLFRARTHTHARASFLHHLFFCLAPRMCDISWHVLRSPPPPPLSSCLALSSSHSLSPCSSPSSKQRMNCRVVCVAPVLLCGVLCCQACSTRRVPMALQRGRPVVHHVQQVTDTHTYTQAHKHTQTHNNTDTTNEATASTNTQHNATTRQHSEPCSPPLSRCIPVLAHTHAHTHTHTLTRACAVFVFVLAPTHVHTSPYVLVLVLVCVV